MMNLRAQKPSSPKESPFQEVDNVKLREILRHVDASQREYVRSAVRDAIRVLERENQSLKLQVQKHAHSTQEQALEHERDGAFSCKWRALRVSGSGRVLEARYQDLQAELVTANGTIRESHAKIETLEKELEKETFALIDVTRDWERIPTYMIPRIAELKEENRAKDNSIKKLEEDVAKYDTSIEKLGEEVAEKDQLITRLSRDAVSLGAFADQCQAKLKKHKSFLSSLREDLKHAERKIADLDQRRKEWKERALQGHKTTVASRSSRSSRR